MSHRKYQNPHPPRRVPRTRRRTFTNGGESCPYRRPASARDRFSGMAPGAHTAYPYCRHAARSAGNRAPMAGRKARPAPAIPPTLLAAAPPSPSRALHAALVLRLAPLAVSVAFRLRVTRRCTMLRMSATATAPIPAHCCAQCAPHCRPLINCRTGHLDRPGRPWVPHQLQRLRPLRYASPDALRKSSAKATHVSGCSICSR